VALVAHRARHPVHGAELVEDGAADADLGVAGEAVAARGVVLVSGVDEAEGAGADEVVDVDHGGQAAGHALSHLADQVEVVLNANRLIAARLGSGLTGDGGDGVAGSEHSGLLRSRFVDTQCFPSCVPAPRSAGFASESEFGELIRVGHHPPGRSIGKGRPGRICSDRLDRPRMTWATAPSHVSYTLISFVFWGGGLASTRAAQPKVSANPGWSSLTHGAPPAPSPSDSPKETRAGKSRLSHPGSHLCRQSRCSGRELEKKVMGGTPRSPHRSDGPGQGAVQ
jgi:hypothetical protein